LGMGLFLSEHRWRSYLRTRLKSRHGGRSRQVPQRHDLSPAGCASREQSTRRPPRFQPRPAVLLLVCTQQLPRLHHPTNFEGRIDMRPPKHHVVPRWRPPNILDPIGRFERLEPDLRHLALGLAGSEAGATIITEPVR